MKPLHGLNLFKTNLDKVLEKFDDSHPLIKYFNQQKNSVDIQYLPETVKNTIEGYPFHLPKTLFFPLHTLNGLDGILIIGPKINEKPFSPNDIALLSAITNQMMVVLDRIEFSDRLEKTNIKLKELNETLNKKVVQEVRKSKNDIAAMPIDDVIKQLHDNKR